MKRRIVGMIIAAAFVGMGCALPVLGDEAKAIQLPQPNLNQTKSLAQALADRKTTRQYGPEEIAEQTLSNLLWAGCGINRPESGRRTAPSALNRQEIDIYVATTKGMYLYDPKGHTLLPVVSGDVRSLTYTQAHFKDAPVHLVYVADLARMAPGEEGAKMLLAAMDTGFVAENIYLYCASEGLPTGYRVSIDKKKLGEAIRLRSEQLIMGAQSVGLPGGN